MTTRAARLRARHRKILGWSLGIALVVHLGFFLLGPEFRTSPLSGSDTGPPAPDSATADSVAPASAVVDVLFGPPTISRPDGSTWSEPPERRLEARRGIELPPLCAAVGREKGMPLSGRVRLTVKASGRVDVTGLAERTGDACADVVLTTVAGSLRYHWLPDEQFPAPVELVQPVTLTDVRE